MGINIIKPSTALLPMEDISNVLKVQYNFSQAGDIAIDTDKVAAVDAEFIAIAATDDATGLLLSDRETIKNSLNLGGVPASSFMTKADGTIIENFGETVSVVMAEEITAIKDELYQLRGELTRQGVITEYGTYDGFQDFFRVGDKKYHYQTLGGLEQDATGDINITQIYATQWQELQVGDWVAIHKAIQNVDHLVKITNVTAGVVTFENASGGGISSTGMTVGNVELFKFLGNYSLGSFSFSKVVANALTNKERYTMLNDDSNPQMQSITVSNTGYGVGFNVPSAVGGALKTLSVIARTTGSPGSISCYVMEDTVENRQITNFDLEAVGASEKVLGKSLPISASKAASPSPVQIDFDFQSSINGSYPILAGSTRYIFVVVAEQANVNGDKWEIQFSKSIYNELDMDVQTNNKAFSYVSGTGLTETTAYGDMVFILATIEVITNSEQPYTEGLYTTQEIKMANLREMTRARLTMRINREGYFITDDSGTCTNGGTLGITGDPAHTNGSLTNDFGLRGGDVVAIGTDFRTITVDCSSSQLTLEKGLFVETGLPVYRVGYKVYLRALKKVWNPATVAFEETNAQLIPMELTCIMPDKTKESAAHSDRLVFECDFNKDDITELYKSANVFELQILWSSHNASDLIAGNHDLVGRIYDLTLSFDKTL